MTPIASLEVGLQSAWPLLLLPLAVGLAWIGYHRTTPPLDRRERLPYIVLRSLAFLALLIILASPVLNRIRNEPQRAHVALLVDESASMSTADTPGSGDAVARSQQAREAVRAVAEELSDADVALDVIPFATEAEPTLEADSWLDAQRDATGAGTDVIGALRQAADRLAGQNLQSIVLVSDGRPTRGGLDAGELAALGRPVYVIGLGDTLAPRDLAIDRCDYAPIAYVESETAIQVRIENSGFRGRSTRLRLLEGERELFGRDLSFEQEHGRTQVEIPLELKQPGRKRLRLLLEPLDEEVTERNNAREIRIEVLKSRLRLLFVAARPDWDVAFMARTLRDDPNVDLTLVHQNESKSWIHAGTPYTLPRGLRALSEFDLFVLGAPGDAPRELYEGILQAVERGRGLLVLAGRESIYTSTAAFDALAPALPVQRSRARPPRYRVHDVRLTPQGRLHPASAPLAEVADARNVLDGVPPLLARHTDVRAKPGVLTLLASDTAQPQPVLVVGRFGNGHTAAFTGFPVWRWGFTALEPARNANVEFFGHLVRWLTQPRDVDRVQVTVSKPVYEGGEPVEFAAQVLDPQFEPQEDAEVRLEVRSSDAGRSTAATLLLERRAGKPGEYAGALPGLGPGEYSAEAVAKRAGSEVGRDTTEFTVESYSVEFANTSQDVGFLRELALRTGGRYVGIDGARAVAAELPRSPQPVLLHSEIEVWNTTPLFIVFVLLLSAEWLLRKRRGLL
ncbi:MAG: hypothetical protein JSW67_07150 [Candidatus Latescibacterota bacterium]|nr:MAG: hypothetical protein JSW67_07150 [Candidatus Latescibacterota bacterium]